MANERRPPAATATPVEPRRSFTTRLAAVLIGATVGLIPVVAAGVTFLDPLFRRRKKVATDLEGAQDDGFLPITSLKSLEANGAPRMFPVVADLQDAWNKFPDTEIGSVYLWQTQDGKVECFNARCPHLGCTVNYKADQNAYACPCHDSTFALDGTRSNDIPPRNMDPLVAEVRNGDEVWVKFEKFRAGIHEREVI